MEDPIAREEMVVYDALAQRAAGETPLLLYGQMADRLFGGMPRHLLIKAASELPFARKAITEFYDYTQSGALPASLFGKVLVNTYYCGRRSSRPRSQRAQESTTDEGLRLAPIEPLNCALLAGVGQPGVAAAMERLHTWAGLRTDSLFYGRDVSRYAFRIPGKYKIRGTQRKHILRRAAEHILPAAFVQRPKGLIRIARDARLRRALGTMGDELLSPEAVRSRGAFDAEDVAQLRVRVASARCTEPDFYYLWTLILFELWCRTYVDAHGERYRPGTRDSQARSRPGASFASPAVLGVSGQIANIMPYVQEWAEATRILAC
jgi:asparagine synthase (glutamine-hydrolysing)